MNDDIRFILENALHAPSGDNTQPWHWIVRGNSFELWNDSSDEPLHTLYSGSKDNSQASFISLGAAIENAVIAATVRGYCVDVSYFPDPARPLLSAVLVLAEDARLSPDALSAAVSRRITNRHAYQCKPLTPKEREMLQSAGPEGESETIQFIDDRRSIATLAKIASLHNELIFCIKGLHEYVFSHINWTKREDARRRIGFYFPTLAAPPFTWGFMQLLRHWWIMRLGIVLGLHKAIALEQRFVYYHSGAYGIVRIYGDTPTDWVKVGRIVERLWLTATAADLSLHPLNGSLFLALSLARYEGRQQMFSLEQQKRLKESREGIARIFGVESSSIAFMFRIGHGKPPAARTSRLPFEKMVTLAS